MVGSFVLMPIYITYYNSADYGVLTLLITLTLLFQAIIGFGLDNYLGVQIHFYKDQPEKRRHLVANVFAAQLGIGLGLSVLMLLVGDWVMKIFFRENVSFLFSGLWCVLTAFCATIYRTYQNLQINERKVVPFLVQSVLFTFLNVGCSIAGLRLMPDNIDGPLIGRLVAGGIVLFAILFFGIRLKRSEIDFKMEKWFSFCWPVLLMSMNAWIVSYCSPYILNYFVDKEQVGLYSFVLTLLIVLDFFHNGLTNSLLPAMFQNRVKHGGIHEEEKGIHHFYAMINVLTLGAVLVALPILIPIIVKKPEFIASTKWLMLFAAGYVWKGVHFSAYSVVMYERNSKALMWNGLSSTWAQVALIILMATLMGLEGALIGTALGKMLQSYGLYWRSGIAKHLHLNTWKVHLLPSFYAAFLILLFFIPWQEDVLIKGLVAMVVSVVATAIVFKNEIPKAINLIRDFLLKTMQK